MSKHPTLVLLDTLNEALLYALETATCLAVFYLLYHFVLRKESSFQYNRFYLLAAIIISFSFPLLNVGYNPENTPSVLNSLHEVSSEVTKEPIIQPKGYYFVTVMANSEKPLIQWWEAVIFIYMAGLIALALKLFIQLRSFKDFLWYRRHNTRFKDGFFTVKTEGSMPTFAFFKYLMWDDSLDLSKEEQKQILDHEKVHIKQKHSYDIMLMEVLKVLFWFNPFIYLYRILLEEIHEYEADRKAVKANGQVAYTKLLVKLVFQKMGIPQGSFFAKSKTLKRVDMITAQKRVNWIKLLAPIPVVALLFFIFSCEAYVKKESVSIAETAYVYMSFGEKDIKPTPEKGFNDWKDYLLENIKYPEKTVFGKLEGKVTVSFMVNESGEIRDVRLVDGIGRDFDEQVLSAIKKSPKWSPGVKGGFAIPTKIEIPIIFTAS
ncbi:M56 family metallopeptidase [Roseivirga sp.]|uniref:M56 family metallopeptidase n=1 Tax=Roseivirga sp. TaxID=1964215 RepID=UPI002B26DC3D|nr:M56 family metallopeptidase [Roseivirga sp.]